MLKQFPAENILAGAPKDCCLLILNYNGKKHLEDCLTSAMAAVKVSGQSTPVIVVDNQSTEDDIGYIHSRFPQAEVILAEKNDHLFSLNEVIRARREEFVVILNNDMRFDSGFIAPLLAHFHDPDVFAVTARVLNWDGSRVTTGKRVGRLHHFWFSKEWNYGIQKPCLTLDAGGGCAAFRRSMFMALGGFDPLYRPAYYEDIDLSYRAWKRGWKVIYEPNSVMYHKIAATLDLMRGRSKNTRLICRNEVLFTVKNCGGFFFLLMYLLLLPYRAVKNFLSGNRVLSLAICEAFLKIPTALWRRLKSLREARVDENFFLNAIAENQAIGHG